MKTKLFFILFLSTIVASATVITVDNNGNAPSGVYTSLSTAIADATAGDTLLIIPSSSTYGNMNVTKALTIIGVGFNPDMEIPFTSRVTNTTIYTAASGTKLIGLEITGALTIGNSAGSLTNVVIENNRINYITHSGISSLTNVLIRQNVIQVASTFTPTITLTVSNQANIIVSNNIFSSTGNNVNYRGPYVLNGGVTFDHNVHLGGSSMFAYYQLVNCLVTNNIYVTLNPSSQVSSTNVFYKNNLSNGYAFGSITGTNLSFDSNIDTTDPTFVNMPLNTITYDYTLDPNLSGGSAGESASTDGTNLGVDGGTSPFKLSGSVLPVVRRFDLPSNIVEGTDANATIEVTGN